MINEEPHKIIVIADRLLVDGLRLAGIHDFIYTDEKNFENDLLNAMKREDVSIIITTTLLLSKLNWKTKQIVENSARPLIIDVIDISGKEEETESIAWLIKRALGMDLLSEDSNANRKNKNS
ncbi:MAG: V-type ATP synthase subunit F [Candidatus Anstonellales archaeon]